MSLTVAVIIPALNEAASLPGVLVDLPAGVHVIVVDNGSSDGTAELARAAGAEVLIEPTRGYGTAILAGLTHLQAQPPQIVVILDADHADHPELLPRLIDPIVHDEADLVLSDRTRRAEPGALSWSQRGGNALATRLIHLSTGHRYRDMGPFRALRWSCLARLQLHDPTWGWNVEMQMRAVQEGLRVRELSLPYRPRRHGHSKISGTLRGTLRTGARILWAVSHYHR